jgi:hypothetical protein
LLASVRRAEIGGRQVALHHPGDVAEPLDHGQTELGRQYEVVLDAVFSAPSCLAASWTSA